MFVVFDLDGTLADIEHRLPLIQRQAPDWSAFYAACHDDAPIRVALEVLTSLWLGHNRIEVWTGRSEEARQPTMAWLEQHAHPWRYPAAPIVLMRPMLDHRPDVELKRLWINEQSRPDLVFEDRDGVVQMWRDLGIRCFQVAPGGF